MSALTVLADAASRPLSTVRRLRGEVTPEVLDAHPGGHPNSVAWLLWHTGREIDVQLAALTGTTERWETGSHAERTGLGQAGDGLGYGDDAEQAAAIRGADGPALLDYVEQAAGDLAEHVASLDEDALDRVIDADQDPAVTHGVRLVSIIDDAAMHLGQVSYVLGMPRRD